MSLTQRIEAGATSLAISLLRRLSLESASNLGGWVARTQGDDRARPGSPGAAFRCPVIPGYIDRLGPARLRLCVEKPLKLPDSGKRQADIAALTRLVNATLERWIRARPEIWLWLHRRWPADIAGYR